MLIKNKHLVLLVELFFPRQVMGNCKTSFKIFYQVLMKPFMKFFIKDLAGSYDKDTTKTNDWNNYVYIVYCIVFKKFLVIWRCVFTFMCTFTKDRNMLYVEKRTGFSMGISLHVLIIETCNQLPIYSQICKKK